MLKLLAKHYVREAAYFVNDVLVKPSKILGKEVAEVGKQIAKNAHEEYEYMKDFMENDEEFKQSVAEMKQSWQELKTTIKNTKTDSKETIEEDPIQTRQYWCDNTIMLSNNVHVSIIYNGMTIKVDKILNREVKVLKVIKGKYHNIEVHVDLLINK